MNKDQEIYKRAVAFQQRQKIKSALVKALMSVLGEKLADPRYAGAKRIQLTYTPPPRNFGDVAKRTIKRLFGGKR